MLYKNYTKLLIQMYINTNNYDTYYNLAGKFGRELN